VAQARVGHGPALAARVALAAQQAALREARQRRVRRAVRGQAQRVGGQRPRAGGQQRQQRALVGGETGQRGARLFGAKAAGPAGRHAPFVHHQPLRADAHCARALQRGERVVQLFARGRRQRRQATLERRLAAQRVAQHGQRVLRRGRRLVVQLDARHALQQPRRRAPLGAAPLVRRALQTEHAGERAMRGQRLEQAGQLRRRGTRLGRRQQARAQAVGGLGDGAGQRLRVSAGLLDAGPGSGKGLHPRAPAAHRGLQRRAVRVVAQQGRGEARGELLGVQGRGEGRVGRRQGGQRAGRVGGTRGGIGLQHAAQQRGQRGLADARGVRGRQDREGASLRGQLLRRAAAEEAPAQQRLREHEAHGPQVAGHAGRRAPRTARAPWRAACPPAAGPARPRSRSTARSPAAPAGRCRSRAGCCRP